MQADTPRGDILEEATNLLEAAAANGLPLRLIGGLAVQLHAPEGPHPAVARSSKDIDLVTTRGKGRQAAELMRRRGYQANEEFNAVNGHRRLLFYDLGNERQVDIFVGSFEMCHVIPVAERLALDPVTVPLAELLLTKLQVVRLNEKDQRDILALLHHHDVGDADGDVINGAYIGSLCSADWGLWRTSKMNLERSADALTTYGFSDDERMLIAERIERLWGLIEGTPKTVKWKLRDRVGDRKQWYEEPEEVD
jgi:hypothetical protein